MDTRTIEVETNSVQLRLPDNFTYYQYDVVFSPVDPRGREPGASKKVKLFHKLQNKVAPTVFNPRMIYDRQKLAYCPVQLSFSGNASGSFFVHLNQDEVTPQTKGAYRIILTPTAGEVIHRNDINELLVPGDNTQQALAPRVRGEKAKNVLQLIVRQGPNLRYQTNNGRAYFSGNRGEFRDVEDTKRGIELWRGIFLTVRPALNRMILTVDTCSTAVFRGGSLIDFCLEFLNPRDRNPQARHLDLEEKSPDFKKLEKILSRVRVTVRTDKQGSRPKIIRGLVPHGGRFEFEKGDQTTTVERYFFETHNTRIQYPNIIGVSFERKNADRQNVVPAELCSIEPGQICNRIPDELRPNMVKFSAMKPGDRKKRIVNEINDYIRSEYLAESRLGLERQLIKVQGKQLMAPSVVYGSGPVQPRPDGSWNVLKKQLLEVRDLTNWAVLNVCTTQVNAQQCKNYMINLMNCCKSLGMSVQPPCDMGQSNPFSVEKGLDDLLRIAQRNQLDPKRFIIVVLLEQDAGPTRTRVKYWGDVQHGVMTQCLRFGKFNTDNNQYWNNVAIKLNARLGGTNSRAGSSFWDNVMNQLGAYMVMGADVGHPSPGTQKPSVTSLVYSWDRYAAKYAAMTGIQHPRQEIIENIRDYVTKAMSNFVDVNNRPPASIFFFRDGVSEGEFQTVSKHERDELQAAIDDLWRKHQVKAQKPKITFVIVTKRHHSVFFPNSANPKDNCPPGMVVENGVTTPLLQNFYLQSHTAIQGTSRSSHYIVLQDDNFNYESNRLQHLCYHLCHVYAKATRSVSIPAPVYYADLVCSRLMFHLNPSVRLPTDDGASTASGESNQFDISVWKEAFQTLNQSLTPRMYFL